MSDHLSSRPNRRLDCSADLVQSAAPPAGSEGLGTERRTVSDADRPVRRRVELDSATLAEVGLVETVAGEVEARALADRRPEPTWGAEDVGDSAD